MINLVAKRRLRVESVVEHHDLPNLLHASDSTDAASKISIAR